MKGSQVTTCRVNQGSALPVAEDDTVKRHSSECGSCLPSVPGLVTAITAQEQGCSLCRGRCR